MRDLAITSAAVANAHTRAADSERRLAKLDKGADPSASDDPTQELSRFRVVLEMRLEAAMATLQKILRTSDPKALQHALAAFTEMAKKDGDRR